MRSRGVRSRRRTGADAAAGTAPLRPLGPGHADLQERGRDRRGKGPRSLEQAARAAGSRHPLRRGLGSRRLREAPARWWPKRSIEVERRAAPDAERVERYVFSETARGRSARTAAAGRDARRDGVAPPPGTAQATPQGPRINLVTAVRRTLEHELAINPRMLVFGEDVGRKGGVHAATLGLQEKFGVGRVFDTSLSEEGHHRPRGRHGRGRAHAGAGNPVSQVRGSRRGAAQRLRHDALANRQPIRRADGGAHSRRLFQVRRPVAQPIERGAVAAWRWAGGWRCPRTPRMRWDCCAAPCAAMIRRFSSNIARCSTALGRGAPIPGDEFVVPFGKASLLREGTMLTVVTLGGDGGALRAGDRAHRHFRRSARSAHAVALGSRRDARHRCARRAAA